MTTGPAEGQQATHDPALARSAAFWLRAYPLRWRDARGAEAIDLLTDLAAPDARRLSVRAAAGIALAGRRERWRGHPPLHAWLG